MLIRSLLSKAKEDLKECTFSTLDLKKEDTSPPPKPNPSNSIPEEKRVTEVRSLNSFNKFN